jgi:hypothetical protein
MNKVIQAQVSFLIASSGKARLVETHGTDSTTDVRRLLISG